MVDLNKHWESVDHSNRHITNVMSEGFKDKHLNNFKKYYLEYIDTNKVNQVSISQKTYNPSITEKIYGN